MVHRQPGVYSPRSALLSSCPRRRLHNAILGTVFIALFLFGSMTQVKAQQRVEFEEYSLDNGLRVMLHEDHSSPVAAIVVMYHVGSKNEKAKRTGFAHLFEHMMFQGSQHVADDEHFKLLQEIGASINGTTSEDRTNYFEVVPSHYLETAIYLESDRMGFLLPAMTQEKLDNQRDVVKNERRQRVDNVPYGTASEKLSKALYPDGHPYSWPVIGYMEDLSAASLEDVQEFFRTYYAPNNACVAIAGDFDPALVKGWIAKYFGEFPRGTEIIRPQADPVSLEQEKRMVFEDRVQLPRLYLMWPGARMNSREDAVLDVLTDILAAGKNSRLYKTLVYERQVAQSVVAFQSASEIAGETAVIVTAKPGIGLSELESAVDEEIQRLLKEGVTEKEVQTSLNNREASVIQRRSTVLGKANALATYHTLTGSAENINTELERYRNITPAEVVNIAGKFLSQNRVVLSIVPEGKTELAAQQKSIKRKENIE